MRTELADDLRERVSVVAVVVVLGATCGIVSLLGLIAVLAGLATIHEASTPPTGEDPRSTVAQRHFHARRWMVPAGAVAVIAGAGAMAWSVLGRFT